MERIFILVILITICQINAESQNLLINGDFEDVVSNQGDYRIYLKQFYAKNWFEPTDCSVDIYRDFRICKTSTVKNMAPILDRCVHVSSGNYCIGFHPIDLFGSMEHITGKLSVPLQNGKNYKVSFDIKLLPENGIRVCNRIGYKFTQFPNCFDSTQKNIENNTEIKPFYYELFKEKKIYGDFVCKEYFIDTTWHRLTTLYKAEGGEQYITFGHFAYPNDEAILKQFDEIRTNPFFDRVVKFMKDNKSLVIRNLTPQIPLIQNEMYDYYLLDNIVVEEISGTIIDNLDYATCENCIDNDSLTIFIPNHREYYIDKGFSGELTLDMQIKIKPSEKCIIQYGNHHQIIIFNTDITKPERYSAMSYSFKCLANKLKTKPVVFSIEKTNQKELEHLKSTFKFNPYETISFEGLIFTL